MANATAPRNTDSLGGSLRQVGDPLPVKGGEKLVQGCIVALGSDGYLVDGYSAGQSSSLAVVGIAAKSVDNTNGSDGDATCVALSGIFEMLNHAGDLDQSDVGTTVKVVDNQSVSSSGSGSDAGTLYGFNAANGQAWVVFNKVLPV